MLSMGAEFGQSQCGNNNAYAQDNEVAWLDWAAADPGLLAWTRHLIAIRSTHPALRDDRFLTGGAKDASLQPDVLWLRPDGGAMEPADWQARPDETLTVILHVPEPTEDRVALLFNRGAQPVDLALPPPTDGHAWHVLAESATDQRPNLPHTGTIFQAAARSVSVLAQLPVAVRHRGGGTDNTILHRLADTAGIAADWWEVDGTRHVVSEDTKRALLAAMGLPARTPAEANDSLQALAKTRDRRQVPQAVTVFDDEPARLALPLEPGLSPRPFWLNLALEDGSIQRLRFGAGDGAVSPAIAADARPGQSWTLQLPRLPIGRHRVWRDDFPDIQCHVTAAPSRCHLPAALAAGRRRFGLSAQLYSVRREGDQGIGDFTTLAALSEGAAAEGAAILAINPLHALFPGQRDRASPYHPSDRRFLDPIYLDLATLDDDLAPSRAPSRTEAAWTSLSAKPDVDYQAVWSLKRAALEQRFAAFDAACRDHPNSPAAQAFAAFQAKGGAMLHRFATFEAIAERHPGQPWQHWPEALRHAHGRAVAEWAETHAPRIRFHLYLQFLAERQLAAAAGRGRSAGLSLGLLRDLAVGAAPDGAEAWAGTDLLARGASIGAPPDPFSAGGQIWGLPPPNPLALASDGFAGFAALLAANMRHAGGLRIDHVMGLSRLFWVPEGAKGADGAYVSYPFRHLLGQLTLESRRAGCLIVGEDLGTVPGRLPRSPGEGRYPELSRPAAGTRGPRVQAARRLSRPGARQRVDPRSAHGRGLAGRRGYRRTGATRPAREPRRCPGAPRSGEAGAGGCRAARGHCLVGNQHRRARLCRALAGRAHARPGRRSRRHNEGREPAGHRHRTAELAPQARHPAARPAANRTGPGHPANPARHTPAGRGHPSRYARRAVPLNSASFSSAEAPAAIRLNAFHSTAQLAPIFSTGKLLSNRQRWAPNNSMQVSI